MAILFFGVIGIESAFLKRYCGKSVLLKKRTFGGDKEVHQTFSHNVSFIHENTI